MAHTITTTILPIRANLYNKKNVIEYGPANLTKYCNVA